MVNVGTVDVMPSRVYGRREDCRVLAPRGHASWYWVLRCRAGWAQASLRHTPEHDVGAVPGRSWHKVMYWRRNQQFPAGGASTLGLGVSRGHDRVRSMCPASQ